MKLIVFDIDGVLTDGTIIVDSGGTEQKQINLKDVDAVFELHRNGYLLAAVTGEDTGIVDYFEKRFPWDYFYRGKKNKKEILKELEALTGIGREHTCYIGDAKYDVEPLEYAGLGVVPANAIDRARDAADIILRNEGGKGCVWELVSILENWREKESSGFFFYKRLEEHNRIFKNLASDRELMNRVMEIGDRMTGLLQNGGGIYLCGNGGSAADAQHIATEFVSRFYRERPGMNAEALSVNTSTLTAIGNDYSFERIFVRQLEAKAKPGDMVIGISTSGRSVNVLEALRYARKQGIISVLFMGSFENPGSEDAAEYIVKVPSLITPRIQEAHIFIGHVLAEYVEYRMFGKNKGSCLGE